MAKRKEPKEEQPTEEQLTPLDRLINLRKSVGHGHVNSELLDILIDANGGDSEAIRYEIDNPEPANVEEPESGEPAEPPE